MKVLFFSVILTMTVIGIESSNHCTSSECLSFVNSMKNHMNDQVKPCDDFYEYACGNWGKYNQIPGDKEFWDIFEILHQGMLGKLKGLFSDTVDGKNTTGAFRKAKKMYKSCMDLDGIENNGVKTLLSILNKTGGFPAMMPAHDWTPSAEFLHKMHASYAKTMFSSLFYTFGVYPYSKNSSVSYLHMFGPFPTASQMILQANSSNLIGNLTEIIKILASENGYKVDVESVKNDIKNVIDFVYPLAEMATRVEEDLKDRPMLVEDFLELYDNHSHSDNSKIISMDFFQTFFDKTGVQLRAKDTINIFGLDLILNTIKLLDSTSIRTLVNYIQLNVVLKLIKGTSKKLRDIGFGLEQTISDIETEQKREEFCMESLGFEHAMSYEFMKRYVRTDAELLVNEIITEISTAANNILNETSWLSPDEVNYINRKLSLMKRFIAFPDWYEKPSAIDNYYQQCIISENFIENLVEVQRFVTNLSLSELAAPTEKKMQLTPTGITAGWAARHNSIEFPYGLLQAPIFSENYPRLFQYAAFGSVAGHEISHAFANGGIRYDEYGNEGAWSSDATEKKFDSKANCFVRQFNGYKTYSTDNETIYVDGKNTEMENIADSSGLIIAYRAYQDHKTSNYIDLHLPGLESFNDDQLFFLAYAQIMCSTVRVSYLRGAGKQEAHSAPKYRLIGSLSNMIGFSTALDCSVNSTMNPSEKCVIWGADYNLAIK